MSHPISDKPRGRESAADPLAAEARVAAVQRLDGQVVAVTGGGGVIGAAIARRLSQAGADVVIGDLEAARAEAAAGAVRAAGGRAVGCAVDVSSQSACHAFVEAAGAMFGRLDVLVCAAGITHIDTLEEVDAHTWRRVFAVNLEGPLYCMQAAWRLMHSQPVHNATLRRGTVVNIGSQGSEFPMPTSAAYGASKRALTYLTETAAVAYAPSQIAVNIILPGMVYEGMWKDVNLARSVLNGEDLESRMDRDLSETPSGRFQRPEEFAGFVLFAAASRGMAMNGKIIWSEPHVV